MTLTAFIISVLWILTLIIAFSLFLQVIELKAGQKSLDQQISDLRKQVHKNQHNIENIQKSDYIQNLNQQASVSKHLIKG
jgi:cell division protein FtsB